MQQTTGTSEGKRKDGQNMGFKTVQKIFKNYECIGMQFNEFLIMEETLHEAVMSHDVVRYCIDWMPQSKIANVTLSITVPGFFDYEMDVIFTDSDFTDVERTD